MQQPTHYHSGLHNHEHFSYANNKNVLQPPPSFTGFNPDAEKKSSMEDLLTEFIKESRNWTNLVDSTIMSPKKTI